MKVVQKKVAVEGGKDVFKCVVCVRRWGRVGGGGSSCLKVEKNNDDCDGDDFQRLPEMEKEKKIRFEIYCLPPGLDKCKYTHLERSS